MRRSQPYRPSVGGRVKNGSVARRVRSKSPSGEAKRSRGKDHDGGRVLLCLIGAALVIAVGFLFAVKSQTGVFNLGREEANLSEYLRDASHQQRVETSREESTISDLQRSALTGAGLFREKLADQGEQTREAAVVKPTPAVLQVAAKPAAKRAKRESRQKRVVSVVRVRKGDDADRRRRRD